MSWIITVDRITPADEPQEVGIQGPRGSRTNWKDDATKAAAFPFRMYDDDGELYYEGLCTERDDFGPLDDFGSPNAGCTEIRYRQNGRSGAWVTL